MPEQMSLAKNLLTGSASSEMAQEYLAANAVQKEVIQKLTPEKHATALHPGNWFWRMWYGTVEFFRFSCSSHLHWTTTLAATNPFQKATTKL